MRKKEKRTLTIRVPRVDTVRKFRNVAFYGYVIFVTCLVGSRTRVGKKAVKISKDLFAKQLGKLLKIANRMKESDTAKKMLASIPTSMGK